MDRGRVVPAVALVAAVIALGTLAGGLDGQSSVDGERSPGVGIGEGEGSGLGSGSGIGFNSTNTNEIGFPAWLGKAMLLALVWASALLAGGYLVLVLLAATRADLLEIVVRWMTRFVIVGVGMAVLLVLISFLQSLFNHGGGGIFGGDPSAGTGVSGTDVPIPASDMLGAIFILVGAALVVLVLASLLPSRDGGGTPTPTSGTTPRSESEPPSPALSPDATVEDAAASNEVYRAWLELRGHVDERDRTASPAEIERRAREAGLDEGAVTELTDLFVATRYGPEDVTGDSERRARDLATRLEDGSEGTNV